jgi:hypothetical protein
MLGLARDAMAEFKEDPTDYAFMARYRDGGNQFDIRIAGVVRRALAQAGFPTRPILQGVFKDYGANPDGAPASLLLTGSCLTEAVTGTLSAGLRVAEVGPRRSCLLRRDHFATAMITHTAPQLRS